MNRLCFLLIFLLCTFIIAIGQNSNKSLRLTKIENRFDIDSLKYVEVGSRDSVVVYSKYFSRKGDTISVYKWNMLHSSIDKIQKKIKANFDYNTQKCKGVQLYYSSLIVKKRYLNYVLSEV